MGPQDAWRWTLNWDTIAPYEIMIGSCPRSAGDVARIAKEAGATAILSLQCDDCLDALQVDIHEIARASARHRLLWARVPTRDFDSRDQANGLPHATRALGALMLLGHRVYVHCTAGINRASLTVLAYLTDIKGVPLDEAYALVRERRSQANPYLESWRAARAHVLAGRQDEVRDAARKIAEARKLAATSPKKPERSDGGLAGGEEAHSGSLPGYPTPEHERLANAPSYDPTADWFLAEGSVVRAESVRGAEAIVALVEGERAAHAAALAAAEERAELEHATALEAEARAAEAEARAAAAEAKAAAAVAAAEARTIAAESGSDARVAAAEAAVRAAASRQVAREAAGHLAAPTAAIDGIRRARAQAAELAETLEELASIEHGIQAAIEETIEDEEE